MKPNKTMARGHQAVVVAEAFITEKMITNKLPKLPVCHVQNNGHQPSPTLGRWSIHE